MSSNISLLQRARLFVLLLAVILGLPVTTAGTWLIYEQSAKDKQEMLAERAPLVIQLIENDILAKKQALHSAATLLEADRIDQITQHSLKTWFALRNENRVSASKRLVLVESSKADFALELERLKDDGFGYVFIDTPPVDKTWMARVFACSDLVVVPTKAGPFDIAAARPTIQMALNKEIPVRWFLSGVILPKPEVKEIAIELLKTAKVCPGVVKELSDVVRATQLGMGIFEFNPESPASSAYYLNWLDIQNELSKTSEFKHRI